MNLEHWNRELSHLTIEDAFRFVCSKFKERKTFSTSFGIEDQMILAILDTQKLHDVKVFTLDTARLFPQTYDVFEKTQKRFKHFDIQAYFPKSDDIKDYISKNGINGFYDSIEKRKKCCHIRKVLPLQQALKDTKLWITGLRAEQSQDRNTLDYLVWDETYQLVKYNPLFNTEIEDIESYIVQHKIPMNTLYYKGYKSIGCAPCTRALEPGENIRSGRWWWESSNKECGLHKS